MTVKNKLRKNWSILLVLAFLLTTVLYVCYYGEDVYIPIHDNLDPIITWFKMLKDNHLFWSHGTALPFLGGG